MEQYLNIANYLLGEEYEVTPGAGSNTIPGVGLLRNDFNKIWPVGFTADTTTISEKEAEDVVNVLATNTLALLQGYKNQCEDNIETVRKLGQKNRLDDLLIRLHLVEKAIFLKNQMAAHPEN